MQDVENSECESELKLQLMSIKQLKSAEDQLRLLTNKRIKLKDGDDFQLIPLVTRWVSNEKDLSLSVTMDRVILDILGTEDYVISVERHATSDGS